MLKISNSEVHQCILPKKKKKKKKEKKKKINEQKKKKKKKRKKEKRETYRKTISGIYTLEILAVMGFIQNIKL